MLEDQKAIFTQILTIIQEEAPEAVLLCGDIYDKTTPSAEAMALFDWFLTELAGTGARCCSSAGTMIPPNG